MALVNSGLVGELSGSIGGLEFAQAKGSNVAKQRKTRRPRFTPARLVAWEFHRVQIARWRALTDAQRTAWNTAAQQRPRPDRFGVDRQLSGFQLFLTMPADFRFGAPENWQNVPPLNTFAIQDITTIYWDVAFNLTIEGLTPAPPVAYCYGYAYFSRWQQPNQKHAKNWRSAGPSYRDPAFSFDWFTNLSYLNTPGISDEWVHLKFKFWAPDYWPVWYDAGLVQINAPH